MTPLPWKSSLATLALLLAAGCESKKSDPVEVDARQMGREVGQAARKVGEAAGAAADGVR